MVAICVLQDFAKTALLEHFDPMSDLCSDLPCLAGIYSWGDNCIELITVDDKIWCIFWKNPQALPILNLFIAECNQCYIPCTL